MVDSERSIYPLDSNKKKEKKHAKRISLTTNKQVKTKVYQNLSIEKTKKKSEYTTIMIKNIYYNIQHKQASVMGFIHIFKNNQAKQKNMREQASKIKIMREIDARNQHHKNQQKNNKATQAASITQVKHKIITATTKARLNNGKKNIAPALMIKENQASKKQMRKMIAEN